MDTLEDLAAAGYIVDEWEAWQQGDCDVYALALISLDPSLHFGVLGESYEEPCEDDEEPEMGWYERHYFAHDGRYAYDSAGRHTLPYHGVHGDCDVVILDHTPEDFGVRVGTRTDSLAAAVAHANRHGVMTSTPHAAAS